MSSAKPILIFSNFFFFKNMQTKRTISDAFILESMEKIISILLKDQGFEGIQPQALDMFSNTLHSCTLEQTKTKVNKS
jgi:hypothetical protein